jgi:hypothetical protein
MFNWKIIEISANDGIVKSAKYYVSCVEDDLTVETEGYWFFDGEATIPFESLTEDHVIDWIKKSAVKDGKQLIESRLIEQINELKNKKQTIAPWMPQIFTLKE